MRTLLILMLLVFIPHAAAAENTQAPVIKGDFKELKHTSSNRVDKIIDGRTVLMKDGKIVYLLGIDYPFQSGADMNDGLVAAKERLEKLLPDMTEVMLYQTQDTKAGRTNRMGHVLAHLVTKKDEQWINGDLVAEGLAWVSTDATNPFMADQLYAYEQKAREAKKGLWSPQGAYGLLTPDTASKGDGTFRVVEGTVNRASTNKNNLYLNFGNDWRKDFTVLVTPALRKTLAQRKGIDPMRLAGKKVRVRGWIRQWNGPFMALETAERLEVLSTEPPTGLSPPIPTDLPPAPVGQPSGTGRTNP